MIPPKNAQIPLERHRSAERRKHFRFLISIPAILTWEPSGGVPSKDEGITRDVSANSAYIFCKTCPPPNATVRVELRIAQFPDAPTIVMTAKMQAQRVDRGVPGGEEGFAVV